MKPTYESKYGSQIEQTLDKILNKEDFSYDFNADPLYQNYKDSYTKLGNEAAMNAAASASALTGGYGNSYAATAASQANQQYLTQLNERIPELHNAALAKYQMEQENLYNQFGALQSEEGRLYGIYRDDVSDYYSDWSNLMNGYNTAQSQENWNTQMDYQKARDAVSDSQWQKSFDNSNSQWAAQMAYQKERDAVSDSQWQKQFDLALQKAKSSGGSGGKTSKSSDKYDYSNKNYSAVIKDLVVDAANRNDWTEDTVSEYINGLVSRNAITKDEAEQLYENAMYLYPQYRDRIHK